MQLYLSVTNIKDTGKTASDGFKSCCFTGFDELLIAWREYSICSAVFSQMYRFTKEGLIYSSHRRRQHNVSFIGNSFVYDFDDGSLSIDEFIKTHSNKGFDFLIAESKSSHLYPHDRFKVLFRTNLMFTHKSKDHVPDGLKSMSIEMYEPLYVGFAIQMGFWEHCDQSTKGIERLCSNLAPDGRAEICLTSPQ